MSAGRGADECWRGADECLARGAGASGWSPRPARMAGNASRSVRTSRRGGAAPVEREQPQRAAGQEVERVAVGVAVAGAEVQAGVGQAVAAVGRQRAEPVARGHPGADPHLRDHRLVGAAEASVVDHDDVEPGDLAGERHPPGRDREHQLTGRAQQVDTPMTGAVGVVGRVEALHHAGWRVERPHPGRGGRRRTAASTSGSSRARTEPSRPAATAGRRGREGIGRMRHTLGRWGRGWRGEGAGLWTGGRGVPVVDFGWRGPYA